MAYLLDGRTDVEIAFEAIYLPGEEIEYEWSALSTRDFTLRIYTRGQWWEFALFRSDFADPIELFATIKRDIEKRASKVAELT